MPHRPLSRVLGRHPSGLFILTARHNGLETGMLASWVMQAGFEPPMITVAVRQGRYVAEWLTARATFVVNVLSQGQKPLLAHFSKGFEPGEPAFEGVQIDRTASGLPALRESIGYLECKPVSHLDSGDHRIFLAEVTGGHFTSDDGPLVHIRKSGMHY
jgi:flavin reductase (DIM6/NTAB) family NADH-FMN oxidoreductase RutF